MKKTLIVLGVLSTAFTFNLKAQTIINPQAGVSFQSATDDPENSETKALVGYTIGADARFGSRLYFQPGLFFGQSSTQYSTIDSNLTVDDVESKLNRNIFTLKALAGFDLVHKDGFKLRINGGPVVDFITKTKNEDATVSKDDINSTILNARLGAGVDIWFLSFDIGYSWGLTEAFKSSTNAGDAKFNTLYITAGVVFGSGIKK